MLMASTPEPCRSVGNYTPIFLFCGVAYLLALLVVHLVNPRYAPVTNLANLEH
jgi:ACS family hexuronate transporter-like MFS transporter